MGGYNNSNPTFENVHNSSISDCTDFKQTIDNSEPKTETIDIQDQTSIIDNGDQDKSELESTEIVHIGTKDDCSILIKIGERNYKALWDSGAGKCVISYEKYKSIPEKLKTQLFPSKILIKAANGSMIENKGECDIAFKIGPARFTFTFLVSNELTQDVILGYNFSKAFHIGTKKLVNLKE